MNKISDEEIMKHVKEQYKKAIESHGADRILGVFVHGKANYGFAETMDDIKIVGCYIPTFEELCGARPHICEDHPEIPIDLLDIRLMLKGARLQEGYIMETVFTDYFVLNSKYEKVFNNYIKMNREAIFHCNIKLRIETSITNALNYIQEYRETKDRNILFEACRKRIATRLYLNGTAIENCINLKKDYHTGYLWQVLEGTIEPDLEEIEEDLLEMKDECRYYKPNLKDEHLITAGVTEIVRVSLNPIMTKEDFLLNLTDNEQEAFILIENNLPDGEGNISISKLLLNTSISRPVFTNVLQKMKEYNVAEIDNQGVKGMYIKFLE